LSILLSNGFYVKKGKNSEKEQDSYGDIAMVLWVQVPPPPPLINKHGVGSVNGDNR
jgi:hypothetical protein